MAQPISSLKKGIHFESTSGGASSNLKLENLSLALKGGGTLTISGSPVAGDVYTVNINGQSITAATGTGGRVLAIASTVAVADTLTATVNGQAFTVTAATTTATSVGDLLIAAINTAFGSGSATNNAGTVTLTGSLIFALTPTFTGGGLITGTVTALATEQLSAAKLTAAINTAYGSGSATVSAGVITLNQSLIGSDFTKIGAGVAAQWRMTLLLENKS